MRLIASLIGTVLLTSALNAQGPASVSGVVRDENGAPIREVLVVIDPDSLSLRARTGLDGRYRITGVPAGRYEVRAVRIGYRPVTRTLEVTGGEIPLDVEMRAVPIPLDTVAVRVSRPGLYGLVVTRGMALLPHEPRPLRSASIEVLNEPHRTTSGPDGRFSIPQLAVGAHAVVITLDHYVTKIVPVTIPDDGGVDITATLDSLYAEYQRWDEEQKRGISWRVRRSASPALFVPLHEIDLEAKDLFDGLRYAPSFLSRGLGLHVLGGCIYIDGKPRTEVSLKDIDPKDVSGVEVYPPNTLQDNDRLPPFPIGTPCEALWGPPASASRGIGRAQTRTRVRNRGNQFPTFVIWTRGR